MGSSTLLGPDHPLARADSRLRTLRAQLAVTVVFGLARPCWSPLLGPPALRLSLGALRRRGLVALRRVRGARSSLRERAFELIASGREELPLPAVESERSRLSDRRYRRRLARTLDVDQRRARPARLVVADRRRPRGRARRARNELREIARLLRELPNVRARGVALVTRLIRDGATSPLYQGPALRLREELGRIRHVLVQA